MKLRKVEEAQQKIIGLVRKLGEAGEIMIPRRGEEEEFV
jgi:flagellar motor switch protein FliG